MSEKLAVIGLGYVGLPVALAFAAKFPGTIGYDIDRRRIADLRAGRDWTGEIAAEELNGTSLRFTDDETELKGVTLFVVCIPTPIDEQKRPDRRPLQSASETVGRALSPGAVVVYESTVYPGATEEFCGPILERVSGLERGRHFKLAYSPERINPGDRRHTLTRIKKIVAGEDQQSTERVAAAYRQIIEAGLHIAPSIKVAEAAKVIENTQRDLNIALVNELAIIFDRLGIRTLDVLDAAATKWNFLKFMPGLVGGHCIGVDPYYLTAKAEAEGYHPDVILAGRRINDTMGSFVASKLVRMLSALEVPFPKLRVGILGLAFKEDVRDIRNSRVPEIVRELKAYAIDVKVCDPLVDPEHARHEYGIELVPASSLRELHGLVLAVPHREFVDDPDALFGMLGRGSAFLDIKSAVDPRTVPSDLRYWSL
jgi:UDP-N-acetyl-D-glucosamine/UDP-N-acetyl-D-galactosamine dehydrogenase